MAKRKTKMDRAEALVGLTQEALTFGTPAADQPAGPELYHWRWHLDEDGVAWAILDKSDTSANTLSEGVLIELDKLLDALDGIKPKGLIIRSAKQGGFIAGAEIGDFETMSDPAVAAEKLNQGLAVLDKLEAFPAPTVALVHGYCLGGGLELALACRYRIARDDAKLGFPEVMLGLHPGLAGTWRSLRIMDPIEGMTLMLTGRSSHARKAKRQGLVDAVVPERHMASAAASAVAGKLRTSSPARSLKAKLMRTSPGRSFAAGQMRKKTEAQASQAHYPAPYAMIDLWQRHGNDASALRAAETRSFVDLLGTDTSKGLVRCFFLRESLKQHGKDVDHEIGHVHVVGAGIMGGDIAAWAALRGFKVTLQDRETKYIAPAIGRAAKLFKRKIHNEGERRAALDRLIPDLAGDGIGRADLIIEAVPENEDIKHAVFSNAEAHMKDGAILATNTSSILLEKLAQKLERPERFIGIHFFNPVAKMPLVEVVTHDALDRKVKNRALSFVNAIDKLPLPVKSAPGFLVNRALTPYLMEAFLCIQEGMKPELVDAAAEAFGMPMGPIELADQVGLDVGLHVAGVLKRDLDQDMPDIPDWFIKKVEGGDLGRKSGKGIYVWKDGKPQKRPQTGAVPADLADRLVLPLLNACAACLREGLIDGEQAVDAGMVFGTGFAPFRGGPMSYARDRGIDDIVETLKQLSERHGSRFAPDEGWQLLRGK